MKPCKPKYINLTNRGRLIKKLYNISVQRDTIPLAKGDQQRMEIVFNNLFENAVDHGKADTIYITSERIDDNFIIYVKDNGKGIQDNKINKIFDIGYSTGSTGFGLAIAKKIVEAHNGKISVTSKEGKGTTFAIILPIEK